MKTPMPTAAIRSTETVRTLTKYLIKAPLIEMRWARFRKLQTTMSNHLEGDAGQYCLGNLGRQTGADQDDKHQDSEHG